MTMAVLAVLAGAACTDSMDPPAADQIRMQNSIFNPFAKTIGAGVAHGTIVVN